jgi:hypothetical protein
MVLLVVGAAAAAAVQKSIATTEQLEKCLLEDFVEDSVDDWVERA